MTDIDRLARRRQEAVVEEVEAALSGSGAGPRRPRTLNLSPRYWTTIAREKRRKNVKHLIFGRTYSSINGERK